VLYKAVIDLSAEGLVTANCINMAAGILLNDLGLPNYFFENITKASLTHLLASIASSIAVQDNRVILVGRVAHITFDLAHGNDVQRVRIATRETRDSMENVIESLISGHRREYYYGKENGYYTYIIRPETVNDYTKNEFKTSRFLFNLAGDYTATPEPTRRRYETFLTDAKASVTPLIEAFNLPVTGETRFMFNSDFASPQIPIFRQLFKDHGLTLMRAYWEPYWDGASIPSSICSLYIQGEISRTREAQIIDDIRAFLAFSVNPVTQLYVQGKLKFKEMLFAGNAMDFTHLFIFAEGEDAIDRKIMSRLGSRAYEDVFAQRVHNANRAAFDIETIRSTAMAHPDLLKFLYTLFEHRFDPALASLSPAPDPGERLNEFKRLLDTRFMDFELGRQLFLFMSKLVSSTLKTNFYRPEKRSFCFRLDSKILDPLVFRVPVFGIFFVNGHYACATHMRAGNISSGGVRLLKITPANHAGKLDNAVLLNYALGPKAQRLKHKEICENGSAGIVIPHAVYGEYAKDALYDFTEGILDLMLSHDSVVDYHGRPEMLFWGPGQGTAGFMDDLALRGKERGYPHWRTLSSGKSFGIPHNTYGILDNGKLFGLVAAGDEGIDLQVSGKSLVITHDMERIHREIGGRIQTWGMAGTGIMAAFRTLISHDHLKEKDLNLAIIGGPNGILGAGPLLGYQGRICLVMDETALIFDPQGLDRTELEKIAFMGCLASGSSAQDFSAEKLSPQGFKVPGAEKYLTLPDGRVIEDGAVFLRNFIFDPANQPYIREAGIQVCIPWGGFKDMVTHKNVIPFLENFRDLKFIVEGTGLFFNDAARQCIATETGIKQIKDSTADKGAAFSSAIGEVLTGLLLTDAYETRLLNDTKARWDLIREILTRVEACSSAETRMLMGIHKRNPEIPLFILSDKAGEDIMALQALIKGKLNLLLKKKGLVWQIMEAYLPKVLIKTLGKKQIMILLNADPLKEYRDAIITKKLASLAYYRFGLEWDLFLDRLNIDFFAAVNTVFDQTSKSLEL
jgi:glutamate dehydrogenase